MKRFYGIVLLLIFIYTCSKVKKDFSSPFLFPDGLRNSTLQLFTLLDPYPVMKSAVVSLSVNDFNSRLNNSLQPIPKNEITDSLRTIQNILLNSRIQLQSLTSQASNLLTRLRTGSPSAYGVMSGLFERIRTYSKPILRNIIPFSSAWFLNQYNTKSQSQIQADINTFASDLGSQTAINVMKNLEDALYKGLVTNQNVRSGVETMANGFFDSGFDPNKVIEQNLVSILYGLGNLMNYKSGYNNSISPETTFKTLIQNLEKFYTIGGSGYTSEYSNTQSSISNSGTYAVELSSNFASLYNIIRQLIVAPTGSSRVTNNPNVVLLDEIGKNLALLSFTSTITGIENSLSDMMRLDFKGIDRAYSSSSSIPNSSLESLLIMLSIVDYFGYNWDTNNTNDRITSATGGYMTVGDALWSLQSVIKSASACGGSVIDFKCILASSTTVQKNNISLNITFNTNVLSQLEPQSAGAISSATDAVYTRTVPWVLNWIVNVTYRGYGPYYNVNKKDSSGNFLAPDGTIARYANGSENRYQGSWQTNRYKICVSRTGGNNARYVGIGGYESGDGTVGSCTSINTSPWSLGGTFYTIQEISKSTTERAVSSDEEAFYKNFQWLLYEKRFVVIIPTYGVYASGAPTEAIFITAVANGLKGMMGLKPNCVVNGVESTSNCPTNNGTWKTAGTKLKVSSSFGSDLINFSSQPADYALMIEGWGYNPGNASTLQLSFVDPSAGSTLWNLVIPQPTQVYGMIPPIISQNFDVLERLGFLTSVVVSPSNVNNYWSNRNLLLPLVVALAKALDDQVDTARTYNPYTILINLSKLLSRPFLFDSTDPTPVSGTPSFTAPVITIVNTRGVDYSTFGMRNPSGTQTNYYPNTNLRSLVSFLIESDQRLQNGVLKLLVQTNLLTNVNQLLSNLYNISSSSSRSKLISGLVTVVNEIKINSDNPTSSQYNIQNEVITIVRDDIKYDINNSSLSLSSFINRRSSTLTDSTWSDVSNFVQYVRNYLAQNAAVTLVSSVDFALQLLYDMKISSTEVTASLDVLSSILTTSSGTRSYYLTSILTSNLPTLMQTASPTGYAFADLAGNLGMPGGYFNYIENAMTIGGYTMTAAFLDLERFTSSNMITTTAQDGTSLLYSSGVLLAAFADIYQFGRKPDPRGFPFADNLNANDSYTAWQKLNMFFSLK